MSYEETSIEEQIVKIIDGISDLDVNDITEFIHVHDDPTSKEFTEAIMDDVNDLVGMINNNHCLEEELEDEVERKDDVIDLPDNAATVCKFEEVFPKIAALGTEILHPSLVSKTHGHHGHLIAAYKNLMSIGMKIQHAEIQENALKRKIQLKIKDFFK